MAGYNRVVMVGNLTRDPELKQLNSGQAVCRLGLASNRQFKNRQTNETVQEVCFVDVDVWGAQAESCKQYLEKGRQVLVEGRLKLDTWQDAEGNTRSKHSITAERVVFLSGPNTEIAENTEVGGLESGRKAYMAAKPSIDDLQREIEQMQGVSKADEPKKTMRAKKEVEKPISGEIEFKDEPPFQDDLPF